MEKYLENQIVVQTKKVILNNDDDKLAIAELPKNYVKVIRIKTTRTGLNEYVKEVTYSTWNNVSYEELVSGLVKLKYNADEESAIQRKAIMNGVSDEFLTYNSYVEECKVRAKVFIEERNKANEVI